MANSTTTLKLSWTNAEGSPQVINLSDTKVITQMADVEVVTAALGSQSVAFGTVTSAKQVVVYALSGAIGVKLDGEATAHTIADGGFLAITGAGITGARLTYAGAVKAKTVVLG
jgi:hypothetical protein